MRGTQDRWTMNRTPTGTYVETIDKVPAFVLDALVPMMEFPADVVMASSAASMELGGLRGLRASLVHSPMAGLFTTTMLRRESTASSRIEGTRTDLSQLMLFEATDQHVDSSGDAWEVANYLSALIYGLNRPAERPITVYFLMELHTMLLQDTRGADMRPGDYRDVPNWIGTSRDIRNARYVPPPPAHVKQLMDDLVKFIQNPPPEIPSLITIAMIHYQFEAIHPFLDGNGRVGRLLISLLLDEWEIVSGPYLSLSEVLEQRRNDYVDGLLAVTKEGDWAGWFQFFLTAVGDQASKDRERIERLLILREQWRSPYQTARSLAMLKLVDFMVERPVFSEGQAREQLQHAPTTVQKAIDQLIADGRLREMTGQRRNRVYIADEVLEIVTPS